MSVIGELVGRGITRVPRELECAARRPAAEPAAPAKRVVVVVGLVLAVVLVAAVYRTAGGLMATTGFAAESVTSSRVGARILIPPSQIV